MSKTLQALLELHEVCVIIKHIRHTKLGCSLAQNGGSGVGDGLSHILWLKVRSSLYSYIQFYPLLIVIIRLYTKFRYYTCTKVRCTMYARVVDASAGYESERK